ncbi:MAG: ABC transporter permease subunit [Candidatus Methylomirabilia bacterium]
MSPGRNRLFVAARDSLLVAAAFALLLFPLVTIRVDALERTVAWRWGNLGWTALGVFALSFAWRLWTRSDATGAKRWALPGSGIGTAPGWRGGEVSVARTAGSTMEVRSDRTPAIGIALSRSRFRACVALGCAAALVLPLFSSTYQVNILTSALIAVILGLGLNIIVGLAGMLNLGYAAFTAAGAYSYALLNLHFHLGFWAALPAGGLVAAAFGLALGFPVLRLRGDYLAIVTLGFGEIARLVLENWSALTNGPSGIANVPRPGLFGMELGLRSATLYLYVITLALAAAAALAVARLKDSRIGRAWVALREDEIAAETMGIDRTRTKLAALSLGAFFAGISGVLFAARTTFVNPASFTFLESAMVLATVVLGGPGSVGGVVAAALVLVLLPEYLRPFAQYRMLLFGAALVLMMILRARRSLARNPGGQAR